MDEQQNIKRYFCLSVVVFLLGCVHVATPKSEIVPLTNEDRSRFLMAHNSYRRDASREYEGTKQPSAANMKRMYWNAALEAEAILWAWRQSKEQFLQEGNTGLKVLKEFMDVLNVPKVPDLGENNLVTVTNISRIVQIWYGETNFYTFKQNTCSRQGGDCKFYTQVMWADTKFVGCGIAQEEGQAAFATCDYYEPGNSKDKPPYIPGDNCSLCGTLTKDGFTECEDGLCQPKDKCSPVKECKVVDTENCLCSEASYNQIVGKLLKANGVPLSPSSLLLLISVVVGLLISSPDIA